MPLKSSLGNKEDRRAKLTRVLQSTHKDEICSTCIDNLEKYIAAQLAGDDYLALYADVALHLDSCMNCSKIYSRMYELEVAEREDSILEPQSIPSPDLAFLSQREAASPINKISELLDRSLKQSEEIISIQLSSVLIALLKPSPGQIVAHSEAVAHAKPRYSELILELSSDRFPALNLPILVNAYRDAYHPDLCLVEVKITTQGDHSSGLTGSIVYLIKGETRREMLTDHEGVALFEDVLISDLEKVEIGVHLQAS